MAVLNDLIVNGPSRFIGDAFGGNITANKHITTGGTASQFLKGDGTLDSNAYATTSNLGSYLPLSAGSSKALTGALYTQNIIPNGTYNLGSSTVSWSALYVGDIVASADASITGVVEASAVKSTGWVEVSTELIIPTSAPSDPSSSKSYVYASTAGTYNLTSFLTSHAYNYGKITPGAASSAVTAPTSNTTAVESVASHENLTITPSNKWIGVGGSNGTSGADIFYVGHALSGVTAGTVGTSSATSGNSLSVPYVTYDAAGHITATGTHTHTITNNVTYTGTLVANEIAIWSTTGGVLKSSGKKVTDFLTEIPTASADVLGGIKVGAGLSINNGVLSATGGGTADSVDWSNVQNKPTTLGAGGYGITDAKIETPSGTSNKKITLGSNNFTIYSWALGSSKPSYTASEVGALPSSTVIPTVNDGTFTIKSASGGTTTSVADFTANQSGTDDVTFVAGTNITLTPDATNRKITIAASGGGTVTGVKLNGESYSPTSGVVDLGMSSYNELIIGTHSAATAAMTGNSRLPSNTYFVSGYRFTYWNPYNGVSGTNATLTLTFADNSTKTVDLYYKGTARLTTHFGAGSKIDFVYLENANIAGTSYTGCWPDADYNVDNNTTVTYGQNDYYGRWRLYNASNPLYRYKICGFHDYKIVPITITNQSNATQVNKNPTSVGLDVSMGLAYYNTTTAITTTGAALGAQTLDWFRHTTACGYNFNVAVPVFVDVYFQGTYDGKYFYLDRTTTGSNYRSYYVFASKGPDAASAPSTNYYANFTAGKYYWYVGASYSTENYMQIEYIHPLYYYDGTTLNLVNNPWVSQQDGRTIDGYAAGQPDGVGGKVHKGQNIFFGDVTCLYNKGKVVIATGIYDRSAEDGGGYNKYTDSDSIWHNYVRYNEDNAYLDYVKSYKIWDAGNFNPRHYLKRTGNSSQPMTGSLWFNCTPQGQDSSATKSIFWTVDLGSGNHKDFSAISMSSNATLTIGAAKQEATSAGVSTDIPMSTVIKGNVVYVNAGTSDTANAWRFADYSYPSLDFYSSAEGDWVQVLSRSYTDGLNIGYDVLQYGNQTALMGGMVGVITGGDGIFLEDQVNVNGNIMPEDDDYEIGAKANRWGDIWSSRINLQYGSYYGYSGITGVTAVIHPYCVGIANSAVVKSFAIKIPTIQTMTVYKFTLYCPFGGVLGTYDVSFRTLNTSGAAGDRNWFTTTGNVVPRAALGRDSNGKHYIILGSLSNDQTYQAGFIAIDKIIFSGLTDAQVTTLKSHTFTMTEMTSDESSIATITECYNTATTRHSIPSAAPTNPQSGETYIWVATTGNYT